MPKISEPVSVIAHQLKNPIAILREYLIILSSGDIGQINVKQKEYLEDSLKNIDQMKRIISDLLDASKVEEGVYNIKFHSVDLSHVTQEIVNEFDHIAKSFNCEIIFKKPSNLPLVVTDQEKIREVIENFISNAIRYKHAGRGIIEIKLQKRNGKVVFSCCDNGIGIPDKDSRKIFSKFYRSDEAMNIDPTGTGLGLYINKAIIKMSGGKIWYRKNKDKGATFYFALPIAK